MCWWPWLTELWPFSTDLKVFVLKRRQTCSGKSFLLLADVASHFGFVSATRWPVGFVQLPPDGPGPSSPLHPLHGRGPRQGLVRLQEQDPRHPAKEHADRGESPERCVRRNRGNELLLLPPCRSPSTLTLAGRARCVSWRGSATASGCPSGWTRPCGSTTPTRTNTSRMWTSSRTSVRCWVRAVAEPGQNPVGDVLPDWFLPSPCRHR